MVDVRQDAERVQDRFIQGLTISWFCVFFCCSGICEHIYSPRMKTIPLPERVAQMATITRMERGHISVIRTGPDGQPYYNLQHREDGRNVTEYIPREELPAVQENVAAYEHFMKLVDEHVAGISEVSRQERKAGVKKKRRTPSAIPLPRKKKSKS